MTLATTGSPIEGVIVMTGTRDATETENLTGTSENVPKKSKQVIQGTDVEFDMFYFVFAIILIKYIQEIEFKSREVFIGYLSCRL